MKNRLKRELKLFGVTLEKFSKADTRRVGGDGTLYRWYTVREGQLVGRFETLSQVEQLTWVAALFSQTGISKASLGLEED